MGPESLGTRRINEHDRKLDLPPTRPLPDATAGLDRLSQRNRKTVRSHLTFKRGR
jgi:hypothetical protein